MSACNEFYMKNNPLLELDNFPNCKELRNSFSFKLTRTINILTAMKHYIVDNVKYI